MKKSNKKTIKILVILAVVLIAICCTTAVLAAEQIRVNEEINPIQVPFAGNIIAVVQFGCYTAAVIWVMIIGVKYMTSAPDGKAEMKKQAFAALIGGLILFSVGTIIKWVYEMVPKS